MGKKIYILQFSAVESFPPTMNIIRFLDQHLDQDTKIVVRTTNPQPGIEHFKSGERVRIKRIGRSYGRFSRLSKSFNFLAFNIASVLDLLRGRFQIVMYFETNSSLPVIITKRIARLRYRLFIHYHEYMNLDEYRRTRFQYRVHCAETKLYREAAWVSQTNSDRMRMFLQDAMIQPSSNCRIMPNYPSLDWLKRAELNRKPGKGLSFVYVGTYDLNRFYIKEFIDWIERNADDYSFHIYTQSSVDDLLDYLKSINAKRVFVKGFLKYEDLPEALAEYDIGLILYKPYTENFIYNAPNKLFEYLACGLDVWSDVSLLGVRPYYSNGVYPKVVGVDFTKLDLLDVKALSDRKGLDKRKNEWYFELEYEHLLKEITV